MIDRLRAPLLSLALFAAILIAWQIAVSGTAPTGPGMDPEYAKLMGLTATTGKSAMPGPLDVARSFAEILRDPFYVHGQNDKGLGIQLLYSRGPRAGRGLDARRAILHAPADTIRCA